MAPASIAQVRACLAEPPRRLGLLSTLRLRHRRPSWLDGDSPLHDYFDVQIELLRHGRVVWGCIVKANAGLYAPGSTGAPAVVVWSADPWFDEHPRCLKHIADHVDALRRFAADADPELVPCVQHARDDLRSHSRSLVPLRLTGGRPVHCGPLYISPAELPRKLLASRLLPVLFDDAISQHVRVLPCAYWSPELRRSWEADAVRRAEANWEPYSIAEQLSVWLKKQPDPRNSTGHAPSLARSAWAELDFPSAAHWALANIGVGASAEVRALLVDVVDHAATPLGLFNGCQQPLSAALGTALVLSRYGRHDEAAAALAEVREVEPDLAHSWALWLESLGAGPHRLEA